MFELSVALKYLIPRKKHLSVTLIALLSTAVISLVVWLLLVFLSVTSGMEKAWLDKLTLLHAPIRITPTTEYFSSYYHRIDSISAASHFATKTLREKAIAPISDPYDSEEDREIPFHWPRPEKDRQGKLVDPVKGLTSLLEQCKQEEPTLLFQDYEMSGATLKLQLLRNRFGNESLSFLTQVSYLSTPPSYSKILRPLLLPPTVKDINHLFFLAGYRMDDLLSDGSPEIGLASDVQERISHLLSCVQIDSLELQELPLSLIPEHTSFTIFGKIEQGTLVSVQLPVGSSLPLPGKEWKKGFLRKENKEVLLDFSGQSFVQMDPIPLSAPLVVQTTLQQEALSQFFPIQEIPFQAKGVVQNHLLQGRISWKEGSLHSFTLLSNPSSPWACFGSSDEITLPVNKEQEMGILLPKTFQENDILLGDKGFVSYTSSTASSLLEQRIPVFVAGFYDPGILSMGSKCLLVPREITRSINGANSSLVFDKIALNGFQVWVDPPQKTERILQYILSGLEEQGLQKYWKITPFYEYDFAKDLMQQFQSDKYLFSLVGIIILLVACCNIFSFLILLVNDKKKEIAILQAMGAGKGSIAFIFGFCGVVVGCLGCAIGVGLALLTLSHMDLISSVLSALQGHDAFHQSFYGTSLPSTLSSDALLFICIMTPILSLLAGLIPAFKACKINTSSLLRSDS